MIFPSCSVDLNVVFPILNKARWVSVKVCVNSGGNFWKIV